MADKTIQQFVSGVHNLIDNENIPQDAAQDSQNWYTLDGLAQLVNGRDYVGAEGTAGKITGEIFGYKIDGTQVHYRKDGTKIQYNNAGTWTDIVTGLTETADYTFTNYSSLAGSFTFAVGVDGIYKFHNANPGSFCSMYSSTKNFKGYAFIDKARMILWNTPTDKTGLYGSYIDSQNSTVYTTVTAEATTSLGGTLTFKAGGATRNCFGLLLTLTGTGEVYTDNYLGVLTGSLGGTGTINYISGVYTVSNPGVGTVNYQWEDSNVHGVTDFTKSSTRLAGEGFVLRQDEGGDAIQNVLIGLDGSYYSLKKQNIYRLTLDSTDTNPTNQVFRKDIGMPFFRAATSTGKGIVFMNTANPTRPELTILSQNPLGDNIEPNILFPQFNFALYEYDDCNIDTYGKFIIVMCKTPESDTNNRLLLCNPVANTVDICTYDGRTSAKSEGVLYVGSAVSRSVYEVFQGFDDLGSAISNYWTSKGELFDTNRLKKYRRIRLKGLITPGQIVEVYVSYDDGNFALVGTILGNGSYVDSNSPQVIGGNMVGVSEIGGTTTSVVYPFYWEGRMKTPKFRKRTIQFVATGIGAVAIDTVTDWDIWKYEDRIPSRFRLKQNVSLDGTETDLPTPEF